MNDTAFRVEGLADLRRALRLTGREAPRALQKTNKLVVGMIAAAQRRRFARLTGRAAGSIRPRATQVSAEVVGGGRRVPWFGVQEFGGRVPRRGFKGVKGKRKYGLNPATGKPLATLVKPYVGPIGRPVAWTEDDSGYAFFPAARAVWRLSKTWYADEIDDMLARLFPGG